MTYEFLSRLYWACSDEERGVANGLNFGELYERTEDTSKVDNRFKDTLNATSLPDADKNRLDALYTSARWAYEKQGFINGFRLGMLLSQESKFGGEQI